jgi:hypothetical protein
MMNYTFRYLAASVFVTAVVAFFPGDSPVRGAVDNDATSASQTVSNLNASPIYGVAIPAGYRQWELIAPSQEAGSLDELRAKLGSTTPPWERHRASFPGAQPHSNSWSRTQKSMRQPEGGDSVASSMASRGVWLNTKCALAAMPHMSKTTTTCLRAMRHNGLSCAGQRL